MKKLTLILCLLFAPIPAIVTSCSTLPTERVVAVQSLKTVGQSAEDAVALSAKLYAANQITPAQARVVFDFYNTKFQVAFRVAVTAAKGDLSTLASPDIASLAAQLASLVSQYQTK